MEQQSVLNPYFQFNSRNNETSGHFLLVLVGVDKGISCPFEDPEWPQSDQLKLYSEPEHPVLFNDLSPRFKADIGGKVYQLSKPGVTDYLVVYFADGGGSVLLNSKDFENGGSSIFVEKLRASHDLQSKVGSIDFFKDLVISQFGYNAVIADDKFLIRFSDQLEQWVVEGRSTKKLLSEACKSVIVSRDAHPGETEVIGRVLTRGGSVVELFISWREGQKGTVRIARREVYAEGVFRFPLEL
ncbi:MAG: hypothetical protein O3A87_07445 [Verrucomicrobia bacterium]|nr:hypothetical protein [Verrucomicrobiota bacterium]MDA1006302.1 hypothetical protein [Verrucomicrobiota bacterium]